MTVPTLHICAVVEVALTADYVVVQAVEEKRKADDISAVLYPNDATEYGKELRLKQQFFFVSASIQDVMQRFKETGHSDWKQFPQKACFQMNDTHPTIAVAELMRLLIDQEGLSWDEAWDITQKVCAGLLAMSIGSIFAQEL